LLPPGSTTQVAYNNAGLPGANANFTYDSASNTVTFGNITGSALGMTIQPQTASVVETPGTLALSTSAATQANTAGGPLTISTGAGNGTGRSGNISISTAAGSATATGPGVISIASGNTTSSSFSGDGITIKAGNNIAASSTGQSVSVTGGDGTSVGGFVNIQAGLGTIGGIVNITGGTANGGTSGGINIIGGTSATSQAGTVRIRGGTTTTGTVGAVDILTPGGTSVVKVTSSAGASQLGVFNTTPVIQQAATGTASVHAALKAYGLLTAASTYALDIGGSTTQVQYNNAGAFAGNANFTYDSGTNTLTTGNITGSALGMTIQTKAPSVAEDVVNFSIFGRAAAKTNSSGQTLQFVAGPGLGTGNGGSVGFVAGLGGASGNGGAYSAIAGNGVAGGAFTLTAGNGTTFAGGKGILRAGDSSSGAGGDFDITSGSSGSARSGNIKISLGTGFAASSIKMVTSGPVQSFEVYNDNFSYYAIACSDDDINGVTIGFHGVAPILQPTTAAASATRAAVVGTTANVGDTYDGYTLAQVVKALRNYGLLA
jgi:hypothetical protein